MGQCASSESQAGRAHAGRRVGWVLWLFEENVKPGAVSGRGRRLRTAWQEARGVRRRRPARGRCSRCSVLVRHSGRCFFVEAMRRDRATASQARSRFGSPQHRRAAATCVAQLTARAGAVLSLTACTSARDRWADAQCSAEVQRTPVRRCRACVHGQAHHRATRLRRPVVVAGGRSTYASCDTAAIRSRLLEPSSGAAMTPEAGASHTGVIDLESQARVEARGRTPASERAMYMSRVGLCFAVTPAHTHTPACCAAGRRPRACRNTRG